MLGLRLTMGCVAAVLRTIASSGLVPGIMDFSAPGNSALLVFVEDI